MKKYIYQITMFFLIIATLVYLFMSYEEAELRTYKSFLRDFIVLIGLGFIALSTRPIDSSK